MAATESTVTRHDLLLAVIGVSLTVGALLGVVLPVEMPVALGAGSVPATGSMGYALFCRPPTAE